VQTALVEITNNSPAGRQTLVGYMRETYKVSSRGVCSKSRYIQHPAKQNCWEVGTHRPKYTQTHIVFV